jgi:D-alanyl-D-alanine dipeptidase
MSKCRVFLVFWLFWPVLSFSATKIPKGFVYLRQMDPSIVQEMRYFGPHNFIGRWIDGYKANECILTREAAENLSKVQHELKQSNLSLKVYDCYRPQRAVDDFIAWSQLPNTNTMQKEFYPNLQKKQLFEQGYVMAKSGHSRGSTVDLTIINTPSAKQAEYSPAKPLIACYAAYLQRFKDNSIDMGTGYDCMDTSAHSDNTKINTVAFYNRTMFRAIMEKYGFKNYEKEWWHFTLVNEPYPEQYFNFLVDRYLNT